MIMPWLVTLISVALTIRVTMPIASRLGIVASPGAHRRHAGRVPLCGGLAISIGLVIAVMWYHVIPGAGFLAGWLLLLATGVIDDRYSLPYWSRFVVQIVAMLVVVWVDDVTLVDLGQVFSTNMLNLGPFSTALTVFAGVGVINAVNMVDGMDGLAGSLALVCVCGVLVALDGSGGVVGDFALLLSAAIAGFLLFNIRWGSRARVFMGDAGSMSIGFYLVWLLIEGSQGEARAFPPVLALWLLALPLYDAVGVLVRRAVRGSSPFNADWLHTHHLLLRAGLSVNLALGIMVTIAGGLATFGILLLQAGMPEHHLFYLFLGLFLVYLLVMEMGERKLGRQIPEAPLQGNRP